MKKLIAILALLTLCSCGAKEAKTIEPTNTNYVTETDSEAKYKADCKAVTFQELSENNASEKVTVTGKIIQVKENIFRMNITKSNTTIGYSDTILFTYDMGIVSKEVKENDIVTIWGKSEGLYTYTSAVGKEITLPKISAAYLEKEDQ